jgi:hypothetical protein
MAGPRQEKLRVSGTRTASTFVGQAALGLFILSILAPALISPVAGFVSSGRLIQSPSPAPGALVVRVGLYMRKIYDFDPTTDTFQATFDLWLSWTAPNGSDSAIEPEKSIQLANAINIADSVLSPAMDKPVTTDNVSFAFLYRTQSRIGKNFDMVGFPVDRHSMDVIIEDMLHPSTDIAYIPDDSQSGFDKGFTIPGWIIEGMKAQAAVHDYVSNFGVFPNGNTFPAVVFSVEIDRGAFLVTWQLLPLMFLLCLSWLALAINAERADSRLALCTTGLLTAIFLQQAALSLFNRSYLVLLDNIYIMAYVIFVVNLLMVLVDETHFTAGEAAKEEPKMEEEESLLMTQTQQAHVSDRQPTGGVYPLVATESSSNTVASSANGGASFEITMPDKSTHDQEVDVHATSPTVPAPPPHIPYFPPFLSPKGKRLGLKELFYISSTVEKGEVVRRIRIRDLILLITEVIVTIIVVAVLCAQSPDANSVVDQS